MRSPSTSSCAKLGRPGRARGADRGLESLRPRIAVAEDERLRLDRFDLRKRVQHVRAREVERLRQQLWLVRTGEWVQRAQQVAEDEHAARLEQVHDMAG